MYSNNKMRNVEIYGNDETIEEYLASKIYGNQSNCNYYFFFLFPCKHINANNLKNPIVGKYMLEIYQPCICTYSDISLFYKIAVDIQVEKKMCRHRLHSGS